MTEEMAKDLFEFFNITCDFEDMVKIRETAYDWYFGRLGTERYRPKRDLGLAVPNYVAETIAKILKGKQEILLDWLNNFPARVNYDSNAAEYKNGAILKICHIDFRIPVYLQSSPAINYTGRPLPTPPLASKVKLFELRLYRRKLSLTLDNIDHIHRGSTVAAISDFGNIILGHYTEYITGD